MKRFKKIWSLMLVLTMAFSLNLTSLAAEASADAEPKSSVAASVEGVTSVTIGGTAARIERDVTAGGATEEQIYIRATLAGSTEYALQSQEVKIVSAQPVTGTAGLTFTKRGSVYTAAGVDLLNKAYSFRIGETDVKLAAGLASGSVTVAADDPLRAQNLVLAGKSTSLTGTNVENPFAGNPYYGTQPWTNVSYQFRANAALPSGTDLSAVPGTMTLASGASVGGCASVSESGYSFNLSGSNPSFTVTNGGRTRTYYVAAEVASDTIEVTYGINLSEVVNDPAYYTGTVKTQCGQILSGAKQYFESVKAANITATADSVSARITVPTGTSAMKPMVDLYTWATKQGIYKYQTVNSGGTYLATLNGLGEFSCGSMSGWMYMDGPYTPTCVGPGVGAASYTMSNNGTITWYMTTNYIHHF